MKALNLFSSAAAAMMLFACNETEVVNSVEPKPGQDVEFSISYKDINSRTIYEGEVNDGTGHYFPVSWLPTDQVFLMSNECKPSTGQYEVGFDSGQYASAGTLVKIGDTGLQWSTDPTGNFYSIYPYDKADRATANPAQRKVTVRMPHIQNNYVILDENGHVKLDENGNPTVGPDMEAALLYAQTNGVPNGANVNLDYYNLATALRFTLQVPAENVASDVMIQNVTLIAPNGKQIAGNFDLTFADKSSANPNQYGVVKTDPTFTPAIADGENSFDRVTIFSTYKDTGANLVLSNGQTVELNAFFLINEETDMKGWTIQVRTLKGLYSLFIEKVASEKNLVLKPGEIHRLVLPPLNEKDTEWDVSNWMKNIPRNTYLCEISVPGSWNTMNKDFQVEVTNDANGDGDVWDEYISTQYANGARAFHLDTRWKSDNRTQLGIAAGGSSGLSGSKYTTGPSLTVVLDDIKTNLKTDEFMYVICTFAQGSAKPSGQSWEQAVSEAIANDDAFFDGKKLTPQTTVNDVLEHIVVICNTEGATPDNLTSSKSLYINAPLTITNSEIYGSTPPYNVNNIYWGNGTEADVQMLVSQCQSQWSGSDQQGDNSSERGYLPSQGEREDQLNAVLKWSMDNYTGSADATGSNRMILLGIGGTTADYTGWLVKKYNERGKTPIAQQYGPWIYDKIQEMENHTVEHFYPVGIVLMNDVTSTANIGTGSDGTSLDGPEVMKKILLLNNLYQIQFDPNKPAWPSTGDTGGGGTTPANSPENYSASHTNGGDAWTVQ